MIEIKEVKSRRERKDFLNFQLDLYQRNPNFVPPLYADEKKMFREDYVYRSSCDYVFFNAYKDGKMAGRIQGIIQKDANAKNNEKRCRFCRFDAIDDLEVSRALFAAVEKWADEKGMDTMVGPLNYSDLEREGMLVEGFEEPATFEENYNFSYYKDHVEALGYKSAKAFAEAVARDYYAHLEKTRIKPKKSSEDKETPQPPIEKKTKKVS